MDMARMFTETDLAHMFSTAGPRTPLPLVVVGEADGLALGRGALQVVLRLPALLRLLTGRGGGLALVALGLPFSCTLEQGPPRWSRSRRMGGPPPARAAKEFSVRVDRMVAVAGATKQVFLSS